MSCRYGSNCEFERRKLKTIVEGFMREEIVNGGTNQRKTKYPELRWNEADSRAADSR